MVNEPSFEWCQYDVSYPCWGVRMGVFYMRDMICGGNGQERLEVSQVECEVPLVYVVRV